MGSGTNRTFAFAALGLLSGSLALSCVPHPAQAADGPQPTFLESGDNDLIRFQKGEVPERENQFGIAVPPAPAARQAVPARPLRSKTIQNRQLPASGGQANGLSLQAGQEASDQATKDQAIASEAPPAVEAMDAPDALLSAPAAESLQEPARAPASAAPAADMSSTPAPAAPLPMTIDARLVTVCLSNPQDAHGAKAFDIRRDAPPRYITEPGASTCARFEPTRHTLFLWKTNALGTLSLILSSRLDLNDADGTQVSLDWLRDR